MEIYNNNKLIDLKNVYYTDFKSEIKVRQLLFSSINFDFSIIKWLKGEDKLLGRSFRHEKIEQEIYG
jgi:hypothetical protein